MSPDDDGVGGARAAEDLNQLLPQLPRIGIVEIDAARCTAASRPIVAARTGAAGLAGTEAAAKCAAESRATRPEAAEARSATAEATHARAAESTARPAPTAAARSTGTALAEPASSGWAWAATIIVAATTVVLSAPIVSGGAFCRIGIVVRRPSGAIRLDRGRSVFRVAWPGVVCPTRSGKPDHDAATEKRMQELAHDEDS